jgi:hypothetical protein
MLTAGTDIELSCTNPIAFVFAFLTDKAIGPFEAKQIIVTGAWI